MGDDEGQLLQALTQAVQDGLQSGALTDADRVAARLAWTYADTIDRSLGTATKVEVLKDLGPKLHALLNDLGLTPRGRRAKPTEGGEPSGPATTRDDILAHLLRKASARQRHA